VYFLGLTAWSVASWDQGRVYLDYLIKSGRAVAQPVLRGTFERRDGKGPVGPGTDTVAGREALVKVTQDVRRTVDYLVTRPDVDKESLAFYGLSIGGTFAPNVLALEPRFRVAVLDLPGFPSDNLPGFQSRSLVRGHQPRDVPAASEDSRPPVQRKVGPIFPYETSARPFLISLERSKKSCSACPAAIPSLIQNELRELYAGWTINSVLSAESEMIPSLV
jgi:dienelactone hydrolase